MGFIALFTNMRSLKFKAKGMIMFCASVNQYCTGHLKAESSKMDRSPPITTLECDLLNSPKYQACILLKGAVHVVYQGHSQDLLKGGSHCVKHYRHDGVFAREYCRLFA